MKNIFFFITFFSLNVLAGNHVYVSDPPENSDILQAKYNKSFFDMLPKVKVFSADGGALIASVTSDSGRLLDKLNEKLKKYKYKYNKSSVLLRETKKFYDSDGASFEFDSDPYDIVVIQYWAEWCTWCVPHTKKMKKFIMQNHKYKFLWIQAESS